MLAWLGMLPPYPSLSWYDGEQEDWTLPSGRWNGGITSLPLPSTPAAVLALQALLGIPHHMSEGSTLLAAGPKTCRCCVRVRMRSALLCSAAGPATAAPEFHHRRGRQTRPQPGDTRVAFAFGLAALVVRGEWPQRAPLLLLLLIANRCAAPSLPLPTAAERPPSLRPRLESAAASSKRSRQGRQMDA